MKRWFRACPLKEVVSFWDDGHLLMDSTTRPHPPFTISSLNSFRLNEPSWENFEGGGSIRQVVFPEASTLIHDLPSPVPYTMIFAFCPGCLVTKNALLSR